jgi:hypothetical protein
MGTGGARYIYTAVDFHALRKEMEALCPDAVVAPFVVEGEPGETNVYALTDRASMIAVLINNGGCEANLTLKPDPRLLAGDLRAIDAVTGEKVTMPVKLAGYATRMICFANVLEEGGDFEETLCAAEDAFEAWSAKGADASALRHYVSGMRTGRHKEKRLAMAKAVLSSLAVKPSVQQGDDGSLTVRAEIFDASMKTPDHAKVWLRITPGEFRRVAFIKEGAGYACRIPAGELPLAYDPEQMKYAAAKGAARITIQAEDGARQGGCIVNITF